MNTALWKSRLNKRRCELCGHPMRKGKRCRETGVEMKDCAETRHHVARIAAAQKVLRPKK